jgi:hypothetical protein
MAHAIAQPKFKVFDKYDFVKSYVSIAHPKNEDAKKEREEEAALIANAIKDTQGVLLENLVTKEDLAHELKVLKYELMFKGGIFITVLITFVPKLWKLLEMGGF